MEAARSQLPRPWHNAERPSGLGLHGSMSAMSLFVLPLCNEKLHLRTLLMSWVLFLLLSVFQHKAQ